MAITYITPFMTLTEYINKLNCLFKTGLINLNKNTIELICL